MPTEIELYPNGPVVFVMSASPSLISLVILRKTPNTAVVAAEYDLSNYGFLQRNM